MRNLGREFEDALDRLRAELEGVTPEALERIRESALEIARENAAERPSPICLIVQGQTREHLRPANWTNL